MEWTTVAAGIAVLLALVAIVIAVRGERDLRRLRGLTDATSDGDIERRVRGLLDRVTALENRAPTRTRETWTTSSSSSASASST